MKLTEAEMNDLVADAQAFRAIANLPGVWQITLKYGPSLHFDNGVIHVYKNGAEMLDKKQALRTLIRDVYQNLEEY